MSNRQKLIVWGWIAAISASGLFPPWTSWREGGGFPERYYLIFGAMYRSSVRIDVARLAIEWIVLTVIAAGLYFTWPGRGGK
jgi:hypothetical protein